MSNTSQPVAGRVPVACTGCQNHYAPKQGGAVVGKTGRPKTPFRWTKLTGGGFLCPDCRKNQYITRTVRCEVTGVADGESRTNGDFYAAAAAASLACNRFANWYLQRLYAADPATDPATATTTPTGAVKLPSLPEVPFYEATKLFPDLSPRVLVQLAQSVRSYYTEFRFDTIYCLKANVRTYRRAALPIPVPNNAWRFILLPDGWIGVSIAVGPGANWTLRLQIDAEQRHNVAQIMAGVAQQRGTATLKLVSRKIASGESQGRVINRWSLRVAACFPRPKARRTNREVTLQLGHDAKCLVVGRILDGDRDDDFWEFPAVRLKERLVSHAMRDRRRQIDDSHLRDLSARSKRRLRQSRTRHCDKHNAYVAKEIEQQIAALVRRCVRRGVTSVEYEITDRNWASSFPYHRLRTKLAIALENEGIGLHLLGGEEAVSAGARPTGEMGATA